MVVDSLKAGELARRLRDDPLAYTCRSFVEQRGRGNGEIRTSAAVRDMGLLAQVVQLLAALDAEARLERAWRVVESCVNDLLQPRTPSACPATGSVPTSELRDDVSVPTAMWRSSRMVPPLGCFFCSWRAMASPTTPPPMTCAGGEQREERTGRATHAVGKVMLGGGGRDGGVVAAGEAAQEAECARAHRRGAVRGAIEERRFGMRRGRGEQPADSASQPPQRSPRSSAVAHHH